MSPCQRLLQISQRTARCGTVRKLAAYRARPGSPRVLAGMAAGSGSGKETCCRRCGNSGRATRTAHTASPGKPGGGRNFHGKAPRTHTSRGLALVLVALVYRPVGIRRLRRAETTPPTGRFLIERARASTGALPCLPGVKPMRRGQLLDQKSVITALDLKPKPRPRPRFRPPTRGLGERTSRIPRSRPRRRWPR